MGIPRALGHGLLLAFVPSTETSGPPKEPQTPCFPWPVGAAMSVTLFVNTHKTRTLRAPGPAPQACEDTPRTG